VLKCGGAGGVRITFHRMLGVTYRSAWFMADRLRDAMTAQLLAAKLKGTVEVDEGCIVWRRRLSVEVFARILKIEALASDS
jgi:hypothetical protein